MNYLFVVAHPDDEVLGAGATIKKLTSHGHNVDVFVLNAHDTTQYPDSETHKNKLLESDRLLGVRNVRCGNYTDSEMHNAGHRKMVEDIEAAILKNQSNVIFTQHPADINSDHFWCFQALIEAFRVQQRQRLWCPWEIVGLYLMEVLSSTDWHMNPSVRPFEPNVFEQVTERNVHAKIKALSVYAGVLRSEPHPRRPETITALARLRGAQAGYPYAEAFQCVFRKGL